MLLGKYRKDKLNFWATQYKNVKQYLDGEQVEALCIFWVPFEGIPQKLDGLDCETDCLSDFWGQLKNQEFSFNFFYLTILPVWMWVSSPFNLLAWVLLSDSNCHSLIWGACSRGLHVYARFDIVSGKTSSQRLAIWIATSYF